MKLTIFGATGRTGHYLLERAIAAGHDVTVLVRNPAKLSLQNARLKVMPGNLTDALQVAQAVTGAEAVISALGPAGNAPVFEISQGTTNIIAAMQQHGVRRLVISAGAGVGDPNDVPKVFNRAMNVLLKLAAGNVYEDMRRTVALVRASGLDWTVVRVPMLTDDPPTGAVKVGYVGKGMGARISRSDMAEFMLKQAGDKTYVCQAPAISN